MKTTLYIIVLMLSFFLVSCNRREKQLEKELLETKESLVKTKEELIETKESLVKTKEELIEIKDELVLATNLLSENDDRFNKITTKFQDAVNQIQNLKNENEKLRIKTKTINIKSTNQEITNKPSSIFSRPFILPKIDKIEDKSISVTHDDMKKYLNQYKYSTNNMKNILQELINIDQGKTYFSQNTRKSVRENRCYSIKAEAKSMYFSLLNKLKQLPNETSFIQYRKTIYNIQQNLNIIIESCDTHKDLATKAEMETCTTSALQALERINGIIDSF